jgi:hypothetical protein
MRVLPAAEPSLGCSTADSIENEKIILIQNHAALVSKLERFGAATWLSNQPPPISVIVFMSCVKFVMSHVTRLR